MLLDWRWNCRQQCLYNLLCDSSMFSPIHHVWTSEPDLPAQLLSYAMCLLALDFDQLRWTVLCLDCENMVYFATNKTFDQNDGFQERMRRRRYSNRGEGEEEESTQVVDGSVNILFVCWSNFWWRARLIFVIEDHPGGQWECEGEKKRRGEEIKSKQSGQDIIGRLVVSRHDTWYDICLFFYGTFMILGVTYMKSICGDKAIFLQRLYIWSFLDWRPDGLDPRIPLEQTWQVS